MNDLFNCAQQIGFEHYAPLNMSALVPLQEVRDMCSADRCKSYGRNWACPPACGSLEHCEKMLKRYENGIIVQSVTTLEDEFDYEGIKTAATKHKQRFETLARQLRQIYPNCLPLSAGACTHCLSCTYPDRPCRFPSKRHSSMEAYGLFVSQVCTDCGLNYNYGDKTISYTSCILY